MIGSEKRRLIFEQVRLKAASRGLPIDDSAEFLVWVEQWIAGDYEMSELRSRYNDLTARRAQRSTSTRNGGETTPSNSEADLRRNREADLSDSIQDAG